MPVGERGTYTQSAGHARKYSALAAPSILVTSQQGHTPREKNDEDHDPCAVLLRAQTRREARRTTYDVCTTYSIYVQARSTSLVRYLHSTSRVATSPALAWAGVRRIFVWTMRNVWRRLLHSIRWVLPAVQQLGEAKLLVEDTEPQRARGRRKKKGLWALFDTPTRHVYAKRQNEHDAKEAGGVEAYAQVYIDNAVRRTRICTRTRTCTCAVDAKEADMLTRMAVLGCEQAPLPMGRRSFLPRHARRRSRIACARRSAPSPDTPRLRLPFSLNAILGSAARGAPLLPSCFPFGGLGSHFCPERAYRLA